MVVSTSAAAPARNAVAPSAVNAGVMLPPDAIVMAPNAMSAPERLMSAQGCAHLIPNKRHRIRTTECPHRVHAVDGFVLGRAVEIQTPSDAERILRDEAAQQGVIVARAIEVFGAAYAALDRPELARDYHVAPWLSERNTESDSSSAIPDAS